MAFNSVYYGTLVHSVSLTNLKIISNGVLAVNSNGVIVYIDKSVTNFDAYLATSPYKNYKFNKLGLEQFLVPVFAESGMDLQLIDWLNTHTFPCEAEFSDINHATDAYTKVIKRFLASGTTTVSWFATIHPEASKKLVDLVEQYGQRAYIGKANMHSNSLDYYVESTATSVQDTRTFIEYVKSKNNSLITHIVTPRFAISCSSELMDGLSQLANRHKLPIQTHLCENPNEIAETKKLFFNSSVYDDHNLLNKRAYMAHCVHITDDEVDMLAARKTGVFHCANSIFSLESGVSDVRRLLAKGIKVGLGTDVAGGYSPSILDAIRSAFAAIKTNNFIHREMKNGPDYVSLVPSELLFLATLGGTQVLGLEESSLDLMGEETNGSAQHLKHVYVKGKRVAGRD
ncbi:unnamed protein product [Mucor hiemalis]